MYRFIFPSPSRFIQRIMVLRYMQAQEMLRREILVTLRATVCMRFRVVVLKVLECGERDRFGMWWQRAFHHFGCDVFVIDLCVFGGVRRCIDGRR